MPSFILPEKIIPEKIIPAQTITACAQCPYYETDVGPWGDDKSCGHWKSNGNFFNIMEFDPDKTIWAECSEVT